MRGPKLPHCWELWAVLLITGLGAALRICCLKDLPPGLHYDEAFKGVMARGLLEGASPQLFFRSNMGEEPLAVYLVAAALGLFGQQAWIIRLPSAVVGVLTVPLVWWLGRELYDRPKSSAGGHARDGKTPQSDPVKLISADHPASRPPEAKCSLAQFVGLCTALVLSVLYWHVSFSRIGMEPILVPFAATLTFAALLRGLNTGRFPAYVLAGLGLGASLYTYKAGYFVPVLVALFVGYSAIAERRFLRRHWRGLLLLGFVALMVVAPLGIYFATHPDDFVHRPASVSLVGGETALDRPWLAIGENVPRVLGMFFLQGDTNPRSNLPGRPVLDLFLALLFLVGLGTALARFNRPRWALPIIWLIVMIVPTIVTEYAPHFARAIGAVPAVALLCGIGVWTLWRGAVGLARPWLRWGVVLFLVAGFAFSTVSTARAYFHDWKGSPGLFYTYDVGLTHVADYINALPTEEDVYLTPTDGEHYTLRFQIHRPFASFDGRQGSVFPAPGRAATIIVLLREDQETPAILERVRPDAVNVWNLADDRGRPYALAYRLPASDKPAQLAGVEGLSEVASFGEAIRLLGFSVESPTAAPGDRVELTLFWEALAPLDEDYTVFAHLLGEYNPATQGPVWTGHDSQPDGGHYPTSSWKPGEIVLDVHHLAIPGDAPPGVYQLEVGVYLLATMSRLPATDSAGEPLPDGAALLGAVKVGGAANEP
jgi:4-amino-4-deoxy-L-arabinose transferase-like glycosyltransferase